MEMTSNKRIEANTEKIWDALNDTEVLKASMPGCESFEVTGENTFQANSLPRLDRSKPGSHSKSI